jgi:hypothetical protein
MKNVKEKNVSYIYYEINKKRNVEWISPISITELYERVNKGSVRVNDIINVYLERNSRVIAKCVVTEWWDNDVCEIALFDVATHEDIVIKYVR